MRWFYPEEKAPKAFKLLGMAWILFSIAWFVIAIFSVSGPGGFAAIRESRSYLRDRYGSAQNWKLSSQPLPSDEEDYLVTYRYGKQEGILRATWNGDHYVFSEEKK